MRALLLLIALASCAKPSSLPQAPHADAVTVAALLEAEQDPSVAQVPDALVDRIVHVLAARNLTAESLDLPPRRDALGHHPSTDGRLSLLLEDGGDLWILVETRARFSVQVNGRYRWNVEADLSLITDGNPDHARTTHVRVPVALIYSHQGASDAVAEAASLIARKLAVLVDTWLVTLDHP